MRKLLFVFLILGFSSNLFAASIFIIQKDKPMPIDGIRFDLCSNGKIAYSQVTVTKDYPVEKQNSKNGCDGKTFVNLKAPKSIFTNNDITTLKIDNIEIKSRNEAFADVLADKITVLQFEQSPYEKKLIGILVFNQQIGDIDDKKIQAKIVLHTGDPAAPSVENRVFIE